MPGETEGAQTPTEPPKRRAVSAATMRHVYVAGAAVIALVALFAAARNGSSNSGATQTAVPKERTAQYYKRLVSIGRGLTATPIGEAVLPALPHGGSTLGDGTHLAFTTDKATKTSFIKVTVLPGASIPWHHHSSPLIIALISGEVIDYRQERKGCSGKALFAGHTVFEPNTQVHTLTNPFKVPAVFYVLSVSPARVDPTIIEVPTPTGCEKNPK
jgi:quercetin dioxygenase-like cupin family protein